MAVTNGWGQGVINNTNGFGKLATNTINEGAIYENSWSGDTALIGTSAAFSYSKSSFHQGEADPTPTITGTAGGTFNADAGVVFVDTGSFNSSTGQIDLSATTIDSHIITYTVDGVQSGQTVGVTAAPYSSNRSFSFDGVNDYFDCGTSIGTSFGEDYTGQMAISIWFKTNVTSGDDGIFQFTGSTSLGEISAAIYANDLEFRIKGATEVSESFTDTSNWHNLIVNLFGPSGANQVYLDGVVFGSTFTYSSGGLDLNGETFNIGHYGSSRYFNGLIDEVSIWDSALSSAAVTEIAAGPNSLTSLTNASSSNLVAWYKMGE